MKGFESTITYKGKPEDTSTTWTYETVGNKKVLQSVEIHYPKGYKFPDTDKIYINPETDKVISKARAYQLGIHKNQD